MSVKMNLDLYHSQHGVSTPLAYLWKMVWHGSGTDLVPNSVTTILWAAMLRLNVCVWRKRDWYVTRPALIANLKAQKWERCTLAEYHINEEGNYTASEATRLPFEQHPPSKYTRKYFNNYNGNMKHGKRSPCAKQHRKKVSQIYIRQYTFKLILVFFWLVRGVLFL